MAPGGAGGKGDKASTQDMAGNALGSWALLPSLRKPAIRFLTHLSIRATSEELSFQTTDTTSSHQLAGMLSHQGPLTSASYLCY